MLKPREGINIKSRRLSKIGLFTFVLIMGLGALVLKNDIDKDKAGDDIGMQDKDTQNNSKKNSKQKKNAQAKINNPQYNVSLFLKQRAWYYISILGIEDEDDQDVIINEVENGCSKLIYATRNILKLGTEDGSDANCDVIELSEKSERNFMNADVYKNLSDKDKLIVDAHIEEDYDCVIKNVDTSEFYNEIIDQFELNDDSLEDILIKANLESSLEFYKKIQNEYIEKGKNMNYEEIFINTFEELNFDNMTEEDTKRFFDLLNKTTKLIAEDPIQALFLDSLHQVGAY